MPSRLKQRLLSAPVFFFSASAYPAPLHPSVLSNFRSIKMHQSKHISFKLSKSNYVCRRLSFVFASVKFSVWKVSAGHMVNGLNLYSDFLYPSSTQSACTHSPIQTHAHARRERTLSTNTASPGILGSIRSTPMHQVHLRHFICECVLL